jgi:uncharacterized protein YqeY
MDIAFLVSLLAPCLPFFLKLGNKAADKAAEKVGEKSVEVAGKLWSKLRPKVEAKEAAKEAVEDIANDPENAALQTVLQVQLGKILNQNPDLAQEIAQLLEEAKAEVGGTHIKQTVIGDRNQVIGSMSGNAKAIGNVTM